MKFKFENLRAGDVLRNMSGEAKGTTIKVFDVYARKIQSEGHGSFTKDYLEQHYEFVKRTKFWKDDKVRLQRSTKNRYCEWRFSEVMYETESDKTECTIIDIKKRYIKVQIADFRSGVKVEPRHIVPVFESEEKSKLDKTEEPLDNRIEVLEGKLRDMTKYEEELEELKLARKILSKYL